MVSHVEEWLALYGYFNLGTVSGCSGEEMRRTYVSPFTTPDEERMGTCAEQVPMLLGSEDGGGASDGA